MKTLSYLLFSLVFVSSCAIAGDRPLVTLIANQYHGQGEGDLLVRTIVLASDPLAVAVEAMVGIPGCSGSFAGIGKQSGRQLIVLPYKKEPGAENCSLTLSFDKTGKKVGISENECGYYHGASCAFEGTLTPKR